MKPTTVDFPDANAIATLYGWVDEGGMDAAIEYPALDMVNDSGDLVEGDVVVVLDDGTIAKTTTAQDTRPVGVCLDDIDDGDTGPVQFLGPVDKINVVSSVTAGEYAETTTTGGSAAGSATRRAGSFALFTTSGTAPEAFLFGVPDPASESLTGPAGGDLSGSYPDPAVVDDSHNHTAATLAGAVLGPLVLASDHGSPITFDEILQADDGADLLYASEP